MKRIDDFDSYDNGIIRLDNGLELQSIANAYIYTVFQYIHGYLVISEDAIELFNCGGDSIGSTKILPEETL